MDNPPNFFGLLIIFLHGDLFVNKGECICMCTMHMVISECKLNNLCLIQLSNLIDRVNHVRINRDCVYLRFCKNTRYRTGYFKHFNHIIHMNTMNDSSFFIQHNDCRRLLHDSVYHRMTVPCRYRFLCSTRKKYIKVYL